MSLDASDLSRRIASARTASGVTQIELAAATGLDRSAIAKIEAGTRRVSALELASLAQALGQRLEWFVEEGPPAIVSHRVRSGTGSMVGRIDKELERLARDVEFVVQAGSSLTLPNREPWDVPETAADAETLAARARVEVGVAPGEPVLRLAETLAPLGLLVFVSDLGGSAADGGTVLLRQGAVSLINGASDIGRRRVTAGHELAHYLVADDYSVDWRVSEFSASSRAEGLFDRFARAFLLPPEGLATYWTSVVGDGLRAAAVRTASRFRVDMSTLSRRLEELSIAPSEDARGVRGLKTTKVDMLDYGLFVPFELEAGVLPSVYESAVVAMYRGQRISAERALDLLRGSYELSDLPELEPGREDELWSILS